MKPAVLPVIHAVMPAAGIGRRMGSTLPKQYLPLAGSTVIEHSLRALLAVPAVQRVVVAIAQDDPHWPRLAVAADPRVVAVTGGAERADSVLNGLQVLQAADDDWVLVHDAVRPCVSPLLVARMIDSLRDDAVGGLLALPLADTLKQESAGRVAATVDRQGLWRAQTPQLFRYGLLRQALQRARADGVVVTDESAALERLGHAPRLFTGLDSNLKITRPEDLPLAAYWLARAQEHA